MDLIAAYSDDDSHHSSASHSPSRFASPTTAAPPAEPASEALASASLPGTVATLPASTLDLEAAPDSVPSVQRTVLGTVETIDFDDLKFAALERQLCTNGVTHDPGTGLEIRAPAPRPRRARTPPPSPAPAPAKRPRAERPFVPTSKLHVVADDGETLRSWAEPRAAARTFAQLETYTPYVPKRELLTARAAHAGKGVSKVLFFPPYGHLLLSGGLDGTLNAWTVDMDGVTATSSAATNARSMRLVRSYEGHSKGISDFTVNEHSRTSVLTCGYDRSIREWDVETGKVTGSYRTQSGALPHCVRVPPAADNGHEFLVACSDRQILQLDTRDAGAVVQKYDQHMGSVNSLCFIDDTRFISACDDKVLRLYEYGIPVVVRHLSDPDYFSMPVIIQHPNRKSVVCQSMDNSVSVFTTAHKFKLNQKKRFRGHLSSGYSCGLTTSPDGRFLASADSLGRLFFWDWKSGKPLRTLQAHKGVCIDIDWHPTHPSLVASCSWDGSLKLWH